MATTATTMMMMGRQWRRPTGIGGPQRTESYGNHPRHLVLVAIYGNCSCCKEPRV